jgi:acyl-CoA synthetase (NDP forming)
MVLGKREIIVGGMRDPVFGPCVMLGLGGVSVEATGDVAFRLAPLDDRDAIEMMEELAARRIFDAFRGEPAADRAALCGILRAVGQLLVDHPAVAQVDINPLILSEGRPIAVDALVMLGSSEPAVETARQELRHEQFEALFEPACLAIIGASDSPLKWGYRILYNTLEGGYTGRLYGVNPKHDRILDVPCFPSITALPETPDLAMIAVPPLFVLDAVRECARKGIKAILVITAGFGEVEDDAAKAAQDEIAVIARETGMLIVGPNCAGVASPAPYHLYSGMISRFPGAGGLTVVSQSGNVGMTVLSWALLHQLGFARFISTGNEAATRSEEYLHFFADDPKTRSLISYVEGTRDGRALFEGLRHAARKKPVVFIKGGRTRAGMRAAQSHTGSLASEARLFQAACRQAGTAVVTDHCEAMEVAGTFMNLPLPKGRRVVIVSQGGGWGVIGADACVDAGLNMVPLSKEVFDELDKLLPGWWSRNNPIDLVAGNDLTILSRVVETVTKDPGVDGVIMLGLGYIAGRSSEIEGSELAIRFGLDKLAAIGAQMELEQVRKIAALPAKYNKPVLTASDTVLLGYGPKPNQAIAEYERLGGYVFASPKAAAKALAHMAERYEYLEGIPRARPR